ncbi:hypothetical protein HT031_002278 [Scenedesmus sp. PABB004]|nr:hypothetical protein HT031_002278 [Scenedesmus sp. PABB004]
MGSHAPGAAAAAAVGSHAPGAATAAAMGSHAPGAAAAAHAALADFAHPVSVEEFRRLGYETVDMVCDYMAAARSAKVLPDVAPGYLRALLPPSAPEQAEPFAAVKADFLSKIMPGVTHWQSPRFFAWFGGNTSAPSQIADMLCGALNMIGFSWQSSPASTELEMVMMDWLAKLCGLPEKFLSPTARGDSGGGNSDAPPRPASGGVIQSTSSEAVLVAMLAARARTMQGRPAEDALRLVCYGSDQAHSCYQKAAMVAGVAHVRKLPTSGEHAHAVQADALDAAIERDVADGLLPFYACGTIGTTSSCAVDPVGELGRVCARHGVWLHVDAAWAGSASILPEQRHWFEGLDQADSYSFSVHKWLVTGFDCAAMWLSDTTHLLAALSLTPAYLVGVGNVHDFKCWQIPLGRRFRSLKLWFVLRMYGQAKLQALLRHHIALGEWFAQRVAADARLELAAPPRFGLTCFRLAGAGDAANRALLERINADGSVFLVGTDLGGRFTLRFAVGCAHTQLEHVEQGWAAVAAAVADVLASQAGE